MSWAPDYVLPAVLKDYLHIEDTADDVFISLWITTSSRNVDDFCQRQFGQVDAAEDRSYRAEWDRHLGCYVTQIDDIQDTTALTVTDANGNAVTDYDLEPVNAAAKGRPYERIITTTGGKLTLNGLWGWSSIPSAVSVGLLLQGARLAARRDSPFGVAGSPSDGSELRLLAQLDPDFRTSLKPYQRKWWAA